MLSYLFGSIKIHINAYSFNINTYIWQLKTFLGIIDVIHQGHFCRPSINFFNLFIFLFYVLLLQGI